MCGFPQCSALFLLWDPKESHSLCLVLLLTLPPQSAETVLVTRGPEASRVGGYPFPEGLQGGAELQEGSRPTALQPLIANLSTAALGSGDGVNSQRSRLSRGSSSSC